MDVPQCAQIDPERFQRFRGVCLPIHRARRWLATRLARSTGIVISPRVLRRRAMIIGYRSLAVLVDCARLN